MGQPFLPGYQNGGFEGGRLCKPALPIIQFLGYNPSHAQNDHLAGGTGRFGALRCLRGKVRPGDPGGAFGGVGPG
ncbi:MAG: hypothetical protein EBZ83_05025, partial [Verrucomicrobia bacterium]|nr:hypothetical protein [Verrucomicrobiota bacterium]